MMKFEWKPLARDLDAEEMWVSDRQHGFLVAPNRVGRWMVFHRMAGVKDKLWMHPCESLAHGKEIAEAWARKVMQ